MVMSRIFDILTRLKSGESHVGNLRFPTDTTTLSGVSSIQVISAEGCAKQPLLLSSRTRSYLFQPAFDSRGYPRTCRMENEILDNQTVIFHKHVHVPVHVEFREGSRSVIDIYCLGMTSTRINVSLPLPSSIVQQTIPRQLL